MLVLLGLVFSAAKSTVEVDTPRLSLAQLQGLFPEAHGLTDSDFLPGSFAEVAEHSDAEDSAGPIETRMVTAATKTMEARVPRVAAAIEQRLPAASRVLRGMGRKKVNSANPMDYIKGPKPRMPLLGAPRAAARPRLARQPGRSRPFGSRLRSRLQRSARHMQRRAASGQPAPLEHPRTMPIPRAVPKGGPTTTTPYWGNQFSTSAERIAFFGKNLRDSVAKRDMKLAKRMRQRPDNNGGGGGQCNNVQMQAFVNGGNWAFKTGGQAVTSAVFKHASAKTTALFLVTGTKGDHNGAFSGMNSQVQKGFTNVQGVASNSAKSMCYRMMSMSSTHNVVMQRVDSVQHATQFLKTMQADSSNALKHVVLQGHGNPNVLILGKSQLSTGAYSPATTEFLQALRPMLLREGEVRSTVLLESCSTGGKTTNGGSNLAQTIANELPGAEIQAFQESVYPATYRLTGTYVDDAVFQCSIKGKSGCITPIKFMAKAAKAAALLQLTDGSFPNWFDKRVGGILFGSTPSRPRNAFSDGMQDLLTVEDCAEFCTGFEECASMKHEELDEEGEDDGEVSPVGLCTLFSATHVVEADPRFGDDVSEQFGQKGPFITEFDGLELD